MAIKTFTTGEVLTAADTNTYLANSGLVYVKSQTVGSGVSSITVSSAFSAEYDNYKIIFSGGFGSAAQSIAMRLGASTASYYATLMYANYAGVFTSAGANNVTQWPFIGESNTTINTIDVDVLSPFNSYRTRFLGAYIGSVAGTIGGYHDVASSFSDFTLLTAGTMTGGTITVYGYRKA